MKKIEKNDLKPYLQNNNELLLELRNAEYYFDMYGGDSHMIKQIMEEIADDLMKETKTNPFRGITVDSIIIKDKIYLST